MLEVARKPCHLRVESVEQQMAFSAHALNYLYRNIEFWLKHDCSVRGTRCACSVLSDMFVHVHLALIRGHYCDTQNQGRTMTGRMPKVQASGIQHADPVSARKSYARAYDLRFSGL